MRILFLNIQSIRNKINLLEAILHNHNFSVLCISEHWLTSDETECVTINNFRVADSFSRVIHTHGGVVQCIDPSLQYEDLPQLSNISKEIHCELIGIHVHKFDVLLISLYRSPSGDYDVFIETLVKLLRAEFCNLTF